MPASRLPGWVERFAAAHGAVTTDAQDGGFLLSAADGSWARLRTLFPARPGSVADLAEAAAHPPRAAVLAVRRGGFACAVVDDGRIVAGKTSRRHVQGRTAAGGWSQQRFARRRDKQTAELVDAAVATCAMLVLPHLPAAALVTAGDVPLIEDALADPALQALAALPRAAHLAAPDPDKAWLAALPQALAAVEITVLDVTR